MYMYICIRVVFNISIHLYTDDIQYGCTFVYDMQYKYTFVCVCEMIPNSSIHMISSVCVCVCVCVFMCVCVYVCVCVCVCV